MNVRHPMGIFSDKMDLNLFLDKMDLNLFYFHVTPYISKGKEEIILLMRREICQKKCLREMFS